MHLFVYGSLMIPSVLQTVTGRSFSRAQARLDGYIRYRLRGVSYPGITPRVGAVTEGVLLYGVDPVSLARLDAFEGELYERVTVSVTGANGFNGKAGAYVVRPPFQDRLSREPWDLYRFEEKELQHFLLSHPGFQ